MASLIYIMRCLSLIFILALCSRLGLSRTLTRSSLAASNCDYSIDIDEITGSFNLYIDGKEWLVSEYIGIHHNNAFMTTEDASISFLSSDTVLHEDELGISRKITLKYITSASGPLHIIFYDYYESCRLVLEQFYPEELANTSTGDADGVLSSFPSFRIQETDSLSRMGYAQWVSWFYTDSDDTAKLRSKKPYKLVAPGFKTPLISLWNSSAILYDGIGASGVMCLFDEEDNAIVISSLTNPMASSTSSSVGRVDYGIMGNVTYIPREFSLKILIDIGAKMGINGAMEKWGKAMRQYHKKQSSQVSRSKDITLQYLGYTTDNGAFYYYHTEPDMNYEDTLIAVKAYADEQGIPYKYVLLDSWWYYKGSSGGVTNWTAQTDIFPNGLDYLYNQTGWLVQAHNRYWDMDTVYAKANGGPYDFIIDQINHGSVPTDASFWIDLFTNSKSGWGLTVYEQDWLFNEFYQYVSPMLENVYLAKEWLLQMGYGARQNHLNVQYCMPYIRHLLQSLEIDIVTQARASDDYVVSPYEGVDNWRIGGQTVLLEALGLASSKDGFWSTEYQSGNPYGEDRYEPYSSLHSVVATLSSGPVAIADGIGYSNVSLVLKSCRQDGRLLQPDEPARMIDEVFLNQAFSDVGPDGEVWFASSYLNDLQYGYVFVADLSSDYNLNIYSLLSDSFHLYHSIDKNPLPLDIDLHGPSEPDLTILQCGQSDFQLYLLAPILSNGWTFFGEVSKWVSVSSCRFTSMEVHVYGITVKAIGASNEVVTVAFMDPLDSYFEVSCEIDSKGTVFISSSGSCSSA